jgi:glycolate oxidase FAD binding subunit
MPLFDTDAFGEIVGTAHMRPAQVSDAVGSIVPQIVVEPGTASELAAVLRVANDSGLAVVPRGGGTKLEWGNPPARVDVVVSTGRMSRVVEHAWSDLTVTVEAGCTMSALQQTLQEHGQRVAVDPLWPDRATVGGVLSTNDTGALRLRFGGLRDLIIGVTIALADGTLATSGGKVVKNVAGYDLQKLVTGAFGTLGVISGAIFRVHPLPQQTRTFSVVAADLGAMQRLIDALQDSTLAHTSLQVRVAAHGRPEVDIRFEGNAAGIAAQLGQANRLSAGAAFEESLPAVWNARQDLWSSSRPAAILKVAVLPTDVAKTIAVLERLAGTGRGWQAVFHATGLGSIRLEGGAEQLTSAIQELRSAVEREEGSLVVLQHVGRTELQSAPRTGNFVDAWGDAGDALALMTAIKRQFDPKGTINPGRFVGGI